MEIPSWTVVCEAFLVLAGLAADFSDDTGDCASALGGVESGAIGAGVGRG